MRGLAKKIKNSKVEAPSDVHWRHFLNLKLKVLTLNAVDHRDRAGFSV